MGAFLVVWLFMVGDAAASTDSPPDDFSDKVFTGLNAPRDECIGGVRRRFGDGVDLLCGFPDIKGKHFLKIWEETFPRDLASNRVIPLSGWIPTVGGWLRRYFEVDGIPTLVAYGGRQPGLAVAYFKRYPKCPRGNDPLARPGQDGVSRPSRIREAWVEAVYPVEARQRRINGMVLLRAVIDAEGNSTDVCVLDAYPRGYGFEKSALEAVERNRYRPALRDGEPVEVQLPVTKTFEID